MIELHPVDFTDIQHWFVDFQKKSKNFEMIPDKAELTGIYRGEILIGYFATIGYDYKNLVILQGYLRKEDRHKNISRIAIQLLEQKVKQAGYTKILLQTHRAISSYVKFMCKLGFELKKAEFEKQLENINGR